MEKEGGSPLSKKKISWDDYCVLVNKLSMQLKREQYVAKQPLWDVILGIAVGGVIPAAIIADALAIPLRVVRASHYDDTERKRSVSVKFPSLVDYNPATRFLIIDDLVHTGRTLIKVTGHLHREKFFNVDTAVLFKKTGSAFMPARFIEECPEKVWLTFPYE